MVQDRDPVGQPEHHIHVVLDHGDRDAGVPDLTAALLLSSVTEDGVELGEWHWHGTHADGSPFAMRGVIVIGVQDDLIAWARLYMEPVEQGGGTIDEMVQETYRPNE